MFHNMAVALYACFVAGSLLCSKDTTAGELGLIAGELRPYSRNEVQNTDKHLS